MRNVRHGTTRWEQLVLPKIQSLLDTTQFDPVAGTVSLDHQHWDPRGRFDARTFASAADLRDELIAIGEIEIRGGISRDDHPRFSVDHDAVVDEAIEESGISEFFRSAEVPDDSSLLIALNDVAQYEDPRIIQVDLSRVNDALIEHLARHPERLYRLEPRRFEELMAALFHEMGYEVVLTPETRDGGFDLKAYRKEPFGTVLTLIERKRWERDHKIGVGVVRALYGAVERHRASHRIVATTSFFSKDARAEHEQLSYRVSLSDYDQIVGWCRHHRRARGLPDALHRRPEGHGAGH